ncbi:hypothetical protein C8Q70DRAFT_325529 [Cubamyces menziesii]|nr:hypothetical protein C8Q70DRAFT_325529 [Cubamyces menziesii]
MSPKLWTTEVTESARSNVSPQCSRPAREPRLSESLPGSAGTLLSPMLMDVEAAGLYRFPRSSRLDHTLAPGGKLGESGGGRKLRARYGGVLEHRIHAHRLAGMFSHRGTYPRRNEREDIDVPRGLAVPASRYSPLKHVHCKLLDVRTLLGHAPFLNSLCPQAMQHRTATKLRLRVRYRRLFGAQRNVEAATFYSPLLLHAVQNKLKVAWSIPTAKERIKMVTMLVSQLAV